MKFVKKESSQKVPIKSWCYPIEDGAMDQAYNLSKLPFIYKHVALMPDCHQGYGMPIGGVIACNGVIIPNAVGVDIGCGMVAVQTDAKANEVSINQIKEIMRLVREAIPVGFNHHKENQSWNGFNDAPDIEVIQQQLDSAKKQLGSLGGGNHFIEIQKDNKENSIWLMLHSGSRNFGYQIAKEYHNKAVKLCEKWYSNIPTKELAFLPIDTKEAQEYITSMNYALDFAFASRMQMMNKFINAVQTILSCNVVGDYINIHHNFASLEHHFGKNVWVHRKGATQARKDQIGIIPGSQGTKSYIVRGLGNPESFMSCSHGAGRIMGRKQAQKELSLSAEVEKLNSQGIVHSIKTIKDLDEASGAYKNIHTVMDGQKDLVKILVELTPLGVVKG